MGFMWLSVRCLFILVFGASAYTPRLPFEKVAPLTFDFVAHLEKQYTFD
jgi:hypothetical protein